MSRPSSRRETSLDQETANTGATLPQFTPTFGVPHTPSLGFSYIPAVHGEGGTVADPQHYVHQQRRGFNFSGSQDRLRLLADSSIYPCLTGMGSPGPSPSYPQSSSSHTSFITGGHSQSASVSRSRKAEPSMKGYPSKTKEVINYARGLTVNDMITELGWSYKEPELSALRNRVEENFLAACDTLDIRAPLDGTIEGVIVGGLKTVRTQIVKFADDYAQEFFTSPPPEINNDDREALTEWMKSRVKELENQKDPKNFFLHERDADGNVTHFFGNKVFERFHLDFWYTQTGSPMPRLKNLHKTTPIPMLALSAAALLCALHREASGLKSDRGTTIKFQGSTYGRWFDCYRQGMTKLLNHNGFGKEFAERLSSLHANGLEILAARLGGPSLHDTIPEPVFIPESVQASVASSSTQPLAFDFSEGQDNAYANYDLTNNFNQY